MKGYLITTPTDLARRLAAYYGGTVARELSQPDICVVMLNGVRLAVVSREEDPAGLFLFSRDRGMVKPHGWMLDDAIAFIDRAQNGQGRYSNTVCDECGQAFGSVGLSLVDGFELCADCVSGDALAFVDRVLNVGGVELLPTDGDVFSTVFYRDPSNGLSTARNGWFCVDGDSITARSMPRRKRSRVCGVSDVVEVVLLHGDPS
jgi:hypothetical protein